MSSGLLAVRSLKEKLKNFSKEETDNLLLEICQENSELRFQVNRRVEEKLNPRARRSPSPTRSRTPDSGSRPGTRARTPGSRPGSRAKTPGSSRREMLKNNQPSMFTRLPDTLPRVRVFQNGSKNKGVAIAARDLDQLLDLATEKLRLVKDGVKLFDEEGVVVTDLSTLKRDQIVYISGGEAFLDPNTFAPKPTSSVEISPSLVTEGSLLVKAKKNGDPTDDYVNVVVHQPGKYSLSVCFDILLIEVCDKLNLHTPVKRLFDDEGKEVKAVTDINKRTVLHASHGEGFINKEAAGKPVVTVARIPDDHRLLSKPAVSILVLKNGDKPVRPTMKNKSGGAVAADPIGYQVVGNSLDAILEACSVRLAMSGPTKMFDRDGALVQKFEELKSRELYYVSKGERFVNPDDPLDQVSMVRSSVIGDDHRLVRKGLMRVQAFKNGEDDERECSIVVVQEPLTFLKELTRKLNLPTSAKRIYNEDGVEVRDFSKLENMQRIWVAGNEPFKKDKKVTCGIKKIADNHRLTSGKEVKKKVRCWAVRNGYQHIYEPKCLVGSSIQELLAESQHLLGLTYPPKKIFDEKGSPITSMQHFTRDMVVHISMGEKWNSGKIAEMEKIAEAERLANGDPAPRQETKTV